MPVARRPPPALPEIPGSFAPDLVTWYRAHRRDLPWRATRDPYCIWISEIMLQQTTVSAVIPYYHAFLAQFPTVSALADAPLDAVLSRWSGLGYYSRARNLKRAAELVQSEHDGAVPGEPEKLRALPGIGDYTAGAILSIAFDQRAPILDGNVHRVLSRVFALPGDPRKAPLKELLWALAERLIPESSPGDFNQGMMELGATVCTPKSPSCLLCPVRAHCKALASGEVDRFPTPRERPVMRDVRMAVALIERKGAYLMRRRQEGRLMKDLWEFPGGEIPLEGDAGELLARRLASESLPVRTGAQRAKVRHSIMNQRIQLLALSAELEGLDPGSDSASFKWILPEELSTYGVSSMAHKILRTLSKARGKDGFEQ
jgi:A/G-specific adenine glycosylase